MVMGAVFGVIITVVIVGGALYSLPHAQATTSAISGTTSVILSKNFTIVPSHNKPVNVSGTIYNYTVYGQTSYVFNITHAGYLNVSSELQNESASVGMYITFHYNNHYNQPTVYIYADQRWENNSYVQSQLNSTEGPLILPVMANTKLTLLLSNYLTTPLTGNITVTETYT